MKEPKTATVFAVCMAWDAFRACLGMPLRNNTRREIVLWIEGMR